MTPVAELGLSLSQEVFLRLRLVNGMAIGANHIGLCMFAAANVSAAGVLGVTAQTVVEDCGRLQKRKGAYCGLAASSLNMCGPWAVATFASGLSRIAGNRYGFVVGITEELKRNVGVACFADVTTREFTVRGFLLCRLLPADRRHAKAKNKAKKKNLPVCKAHADLLSILKDRQWMICEFLTEAEFNSQRAALQP